jgi:hypothetical protein
MPKTITFHNGTTLCQEHNRRNEKYTDKQSHIDKSLKDKNVILVDKKLKDAYEEIFGDAVKEYNAKQKRSDRKIKDYYQKIKDDKQKNLAYECIVQIGDASDTGINSAQEKKALLLYAKSWEKRNPNLKLFGCYLHADESEGTAHLHIDYIPVSTINKRGMAIQNSFEKAMNEQGFTSENANRTAQMKWEQHERKVLEHICAKLGINAKANQDKTKGRGHLSVTEYKSAVQKEKVKVDKEMDEYRKKEFSKLEKEKAQLEKEIKVLEETIASYTPPEKGRLESAKAFAERTKAYQQVQLAKHKEQELQRKEQELQRIQQQLLERERQVQQSEEEIERKKRSIEEQVEQQDALKKQIEDLTSKNKTLESENSRLTDENEKLETSNKQLEDERETLATYLDAKDLNLDELMKEALEFQQKDNDVDADVDDYEDEEEEYNQGYDEFGI